MVHNYFLSLVSIALPLNFRDKVVLILRNYLKTSFPVSIQCFKLFRSTQLMNNPVSINSIVSLIFLKVNETSIR